MDTLNLPFNRFIEIEKAEEQSEYIFKLDFKPNLQNHLNTMHASAMFALAEATSGEYLLRTFSEYAEIVVPVLRSAQVKYSKPVTGTVFSKADILDKPIYDIQLEIDTKGRMIIKVVVRLFDEDENKVFQSTFDWFVMKK